MTVPARLAAALAAALALGLAGAAAAGVRIYSYDPANALTRRTAGDLTFEFERRFIFTRVLSVRSTEGEATADLKPARETALGRGGLDGVIGRRARGRDLYEIEPAAEGADMIRAFCPGSARAWLAFGRIRQGHGLRVRVIGEAAGASRARLCATLDFTFHGEWRAAAAGQPVRPGDLLEPHFPY
ncbi:MAG TPA: hypothetical protein VMU93_14870 [Caulobacteraceae bacterium]|nr:hypothetical protein [Caulobacteraceae bacterium]